jgi:hypothetical protein
MKKRTPFSTMIIYYPNGSRQIVKPSTHFKGDWDLLASAIAGKWFKDQNVRYELK